LTLSITAEGSDLMYRWQTSTDGGNTWVDSGLSGNKTDKLTVLAIAKRNGYMFRCIVSGKYGNPVTSNIATLTVTK